MITLEAEKKHANALCGCWILGAMFTIIALAMLLGAPGMFLAMGISAFVAALITAIDEPTGVYRASAAGQLSERGK